MSDWIKWSGGDQPVDNHAVVDLVFRDGTHVSARRAAAYSWDHDSGEHDIVCYRLVNVPAQPTESDVTKGQVGGKHYADLGEHQPIEVLKRWLTPEEFRGWVKGEAIVYLARERQKGGDRDLQKADHILRYGMQLLGIGP